MPIWLPPARVAAPVLPLSVPTVSDAVPPPPSVTAPVLTRFRVGVASTMASPGLPMLIGPVLAGVVAVAAAPSCNVRAAMPRDCCAIDSAPALPWPLPISSIGRDGVNGANVTVPSGAETGGCRLFGNRPTWSAKIVTEPDVALMPLTCPPNFRVGADVLSVKLPAVCWNVPICAMALPAAFSTVSALDEPSSSGVEIDEPAVCVIPAALSATGAVWLLTAPVTLNGTALTSVNAPYVAKSPSCAIRFASISDAVPPAPVSVAAEITPPFWIMPGSAAVGVPLLARLLRSTACPDTSPKIDMPWGPLDDRLILPPAITWPTARLALLCSVMSVCAATPASVPMKFEPLGKARLPTLVLSVLMPSAPACTTAPVVLRPSAPNPNEPRSIVPPPLPMVIVPEFSTLVAGLVPPRIRS